MRQRLGGQCPPYGLQIFLQTSFQILFQILPETLRDADIQLPNPKGDDPNGR